MVFLISPLFEVLYFILLSPNATPKSASYSKLLNLPIYGGYRLARYAIQQLTFNWYLKCHLSCKMVLVALLHVYFLDTLGLLAYHTVPISIIHVLIEPVFTRDRHTEACVFGLFNCDFAITICINTRKIAVRGWTGWTSRLTIC